MKLPSKYVYSRTLYSFQFRPRVRAAYELGYPDYSFMINKGKYVPTSNYAHHEVVCVITTSE
jgi:hypothetical protein